MSKLLSKSGRHDSNLMSLLIFKCSESLRNRCFSPWPFVEMKRKKKKQTSRAARQTSYHTCLSFSWFFGPQRGSFWLTVSWPTGPSVSPLPSGEEEGLGSRANGRLFAVPYFYQRHCYKGFWRLNYEITHPPLTFCFFHSGSCRRIHLSLSQYNLLSEHFHSEMSVDLSLCSLSLKALIAKSRI